MCKIYQYTFKLTTFLLSSLFFLSTGFPAHSKVLQGNVQEADVLQKNGGMNRNDIHRSSDPFGGGGGNNDAVNQTIDAPQGSFQVPTMAPAPPPRQFPLQAEQDGQGNGNLTPGNAIPDNNTAYARNDNPFQPSLTQGGPPPDPDSSQEMQLAWDQWHKNLASVIYQRYSAGNAFFGHGPPLVVTIAYCVTRNGQITNVRFTQKSPNLMYNIYCMGIINSLNGDMSALAFPQGSQRMSVDKAGNFEVNTGNQGFRHTINDVERYKR
jgi:hypothetical protein